MNKPTRFAVSDLHEDSAYNEMQAKVSELDRDLAEGRARSATAGVNRGLRMILIAVVACVAISWIGTIAVQYVRLMMVEQLVQTDQDSLRVMCAVDPPTEREFNRLHLCELVATNSRPNTGATSAVPTPNLRFGAETTN
ncbi:MAG: hypothetical protein KTR21_17495 [Rhodobacteraceae bacterium]|nr:hypothetical protein [Paracoccaceae bacterium]